MVCEDVCLCVQQGVMSPGSMGSRRDLKLWVPCRAWEYASAISRIHVLICLDIEATI